MEELRQLDDNETDNDKVEIANAKLNEAFRDYLTRKPESLKALRDKVTAIAANTAKKEAA